jgi:uncharacterized protein YbaP (TraB family)
MPTAGILRGLAFLLLNKADPWSLNLLLQNARALKGKAKNVSFFSELFLLLTS